MYFHLWLIIEKIGYIKVLALTANYVSEIDDVFVRKDLYEGKYKPDRKKEVEFNQIMGDSCSMQTDMEKLEDYIQYITADRNFKIEL